MTPSQTKPPDAPRRTQPLNSIAPSRTLTTAPRRRCVRPNPRRPRKLSSRWTAKTMREKSGLGGLRQHEIDVDGVIGEFDAVFGAVEDAGVDERLNIAMHGFHVPTNPARGFTDRHGPLSGHGVQQLPSFSGERLP